MFSKNKTVKLQWRAKIRWLLPTCKSTAGFSIAIDAYLAFLWVDGTFIISGASGKLAKALSPVFCQSISEYPKIIHLYSI
jgi:hypothetical protein